MSSITAALKIHILSVVRESREIYLIALKALNGRVRALASIKNHNPPTTSCKVRGLSIVSPRSVHYHFFNELCNS